MGLAVNDASGMPGRSLDDLALIIAGIFRFAAAAADDMVGNSHIVFVFCMVHEKVRGIILALF